ncbi:MAG: universal stress protein, partial [Dehalococcoidia bacterium]|nr:universal stress protein [Dehalococcoidia bacterium]
MYKKVLVPLDGSELAECTLNEITNLVGDGSQVVLLQVVEPADTFGLAASLEAEAPNLDLSKIDRQNEEHARRYLKRMATKLKKKGIEAEVAVVRGKPAEMINEYANSNKVDLILISTHGRSGVSRWAFGSVADKVLRSAIVPVLLITPKGCR